MTNPPGVAQALSLAGQLESQSDRSEYERALDCAVALRVMASALVPLTAGTQSREVRTINAAANEFENRARSADGREGRDLAQDIEEGVAEKMSDTTGQAQLAIACANARS